MATRLYLVRHGATQLTAEDRFSGAVGVDLSDEGRMQVRRLAERLAHDGIGAVYCSPLSRTVETATILARKRGEVCEIRFILSLHSCPVNGLI